MPAPGADTAAYHLCPRCFRATPAVASESYCPNDGTPMITGCPRCGAPLTSPYVRYCQSCGSPVVPVYTSGSGPDHDTR